jgi:uncharacterized protein (TIGR00297 family)
MFALYSFFYVVLLLHTTQGFRPRAPLSSVVVRTQSLALRSGVFLPLVPVAVAPPPVLSSLLPGISLFQEALLANGLWCAILYLTKTKALTRAGLLHATVLGVGLWSFLGLQGWLVCVSYLVLGVVVTKVKMQEKEALGIAEKRGGARGPENVWGAAATAMVCAALTGVLPSWSTVLQVGYVASLATKLSDTFGSEIGKAFGKTTYLVTTLKPVPRGTEGAVSLEGTLAGVGGSLLMVAAGMLFGQLEQGSWPAALACVVAAFVGTTAESFIGASFQGDDKVKWLSNELVNLINTVIGALVGMLLYAVLGA